MSAYEWAFEHPKLNDAIGLLQKATLNSNPDDLVALGQNLPNIAWLATLLANSKNSAHRKKAQLFAALARQLMSDTVAIETLCYAIFARTGNLPAARHLNKIVGTRLQYSGPLLGPLGDEFRESFNRNYFDRIERGLVLTEFQASVTSALNESQFGVISAPTSAGKSFIVHQYVFSQLRAGSAIAVFLVPTKALIAQTTAIYRKFAATEELELNVYTSIPEGLESPGERAVFALTQERAVRLLDAAWASGITFIFADEIQSVEDTNRGALLEYVLHRLMQTASSAKVFAAGPFITKSELLGNELFERETRPLETDETPVSQLIIRVKPIKLKRELSVKFLDLVKTELDHEFTIPIERTAYSAWKNSRTQAVVETVLRFRGTTPSLVYAPGPGTAQNRAVDYAHNIDDSTLTVSPDVAELIDFVGESIHPQCSLIECLKRNIAYHHSKLTDFVREELETLFSESQIDVLFCTSTLLQGVNLPAEKIFVVAAKKANEELSHFEFRNLIGRAGRLSQHLCGLVYCIQVPQDEEEVDWVDDFRSQSDKQVEPVIRSRLRTNFEPILDALKNGVSSSSLEPDIRSTTIILRARFLQSSSNLDSYLERKQLTNEQKTSIQSALEDFAAQIVIPGNVVLKNPYVDPILQDKLYNDVRANPREWLIRRTLGFATDFERVFKKLDDVFGIVREIGPIGNHDYHRNDVITFAKMWLNGKSFREIVVRALPPGLRNKSSLKQKEVDKAISRAMDLVSNDVAFVSAKYFSVLSEVLRSVLTEEEQLDYAWTIALPVMLELGCGDSKSLALATACVPRAAALKIAPLVPDDTEDPILWLTLNERNVQLQSLPAIYKRILRRTGIWVAQATAN